MKKDLCNINDWNDIVEKQKIGEILIQSGLIDLVKLSMALDIQKFQKIPIGEIFVSMNVMTSEQLQQALELQSTINARFE